MRLREYERFAWEVNQLLEGPLVWNEVSVSPVGWAAFLLTDLKESLAGVAKAKAQRDLVVRRFHHVLEVLDSLDEQLGQMGVSRVVRVRG